MTWKQDKNSWQENPDDIILLVNHSSNNYVIDMPTGRCRLDAGRKLRTLRSIIKLPQVRDLVEQGVLTIE